MSQSPWQLRLYRAATRLVQPAAGLILRQRLKKGKEDPARIKERMGVAGMARPQGPLVWLHGASVGETVSMIPIIERLQERGIHVLVTSGTVTSARVMAERLPAAALHQFIPLDTPGFMRCFLSHWRPAIGVMVESELWPNLIVEANTADVPLMLLNGRMSERSFARWMKQPGMAHALLSRFDVVMAQSQRDGERFSRLGAPHVMLGGNLKYDVTPPPADPAALAMLQGVTSGRPIWVAASTHPGEEEMIIDAHRRIAERLPGLLTIIAPRHPQRGSQIAALALAEGLASGCRSTGLPPDRALDLYVADTVGELGLFYRLAPVCYLGGSLVPHGGQNPIEAAKLGAAIVHGPHIHNFIDVFASLNDGGGAVRVHDTGALAGQVLQWLMHANEARTAGRLAAQGVAALTGATDRSMQAMDPLLARAGLVARRAAP
ncbi:MAG: 3-deoxy-D-manno-octulosonic acid transferase [Hyphomicrobiales bacterium]|jgi:3-deoxy-D-manno-octulosonic-acid transferase|nr:3-deoxy-D-manno-octulosonic acid transferase [Hyphomicrobiales bacterium]